MSSDSIERALSDLPRNGELIKDRPYRQVWRIQIEGCAYFLKFYPRAGNGLKRLFRGNPALREFSRLQILQKENIPSPRPVSALVGFRINDRLGDAVIMHAIEPGITLDQYFNEKEIGAATIPHRRQIASQITEIVTQLIRARLGHRDLHLGNFILSDGKVYLLDAYAIHRRGMRKTDLLMLGHSVRRYATKTELLRAWHVFGGYQLPSANNRISRKFWGKEISRIHGDNAYFGHLKSDEWAGFYFKSRKYPVPWSQVSRLRVSREDWPTQWPRLLAQLQSDQFTTIKENTSGQILAGEIVLAGIPLKVVVKRLRQNFLATIFGSKTRRAWHNAWSLIVRDIPTAWPILMMERRLFGLVVDQLIVFEEIKGRSLANVSLNESSRAWRDILFHRLGRLLHHLESFGFHHPNVAASDFVISEDPAHNPLPILVDVECIRESRHPGLSVLRLLQNLRETQAGYDPPDSYALCRGFASGAQIERNLP